jgi:hypothetical protein
VFRKSVSEELAPRADRSGESGIRKVHGPDFALRLRVTKEVAAQRGLLETKGE